MEYKIGAVKHANGIDWWVILHANSYDTLHPTNTFYKFLVTKDSIYGPFLQNIGLSHATDSLHVANGKISINAIGDRLGITSFLYSSNELFEFDRCTGLLFNPVSLSNIDKSFSPLLVLVCNEDFNTLSFATKLTAIRLC